MFRIYSKTNCPFCTAAEQLLSNKGLPYEKLMLEQDFTREELLEAFPTAKTFPQITHDDAYVGGFQELKKLLESSSVGSEGESQFLAG